MNSSKKKRRKFFERKLNPKPIRITDRDNQILKLVYEHRFINSDQIRAIIEGSKQKLTRRFEELYDNQYLDRPKAQSLIYGNFPAVYAIGNRGAEEIQSLYGIPKAKVDWTSKNNNNKVNNILHTLLNTQFSIVLQLACKRIIGVEYINPKMIAEKRPVASDTGNKPLDWKVTLKQPHRNFKNGYTLHISPDSAFALYFPEGRGYKQYSHFFVEVDRSTEPVNSHDIYRSSILKKMVAYYESWRICDNQGHFGSVYKDNFGFSFPRILFITRSMERIESMIKANKELDTRGKGLRMFLFTTEKNLLLDDPERITSTIWINGRGEPDSIIS